MNADNSELIRPQSPGNPSCPADQLKSALGGSQPAPARGARRVLLLVVGGGSLGTGVVGMFVPLLPTTCFLLLAAWCFGRSSPRLHHWMYHNRWFGTYLSDYKRGRGIPRGVKIGSLSLLWITIGATIVFANSAIWLQALLVAVAVAVTVHVTAQRDAVPLRDELST
jgi:uncharacterized membrane protein YbaN (DUF454 family)